MTYDFGRQLAQGADGERFLDRFFSDEFIITEPIDAQRSGYDRRFERRDSPAEYFTVEYKTDRTATTSHNAFVETVSVDTAGKPGWAYTCTADVLVYYVPEPLDRIYWVRFSSLRRELARYLRVYSERSIPNSGYFTKGRLVPLTELGRISAKIIDVQAEFRARGAAFDRWPAADRAVTPSDEP